MSVAFTIRELADESVTEIAAFRPVDINAGAIEAAIRIVQDASANGGVQISSYVSGLTEVVWFDDNSGLRKELGGTLHSALRRAVEQIKGENDED